MVFTFTSAGSEAQKTIPVQSRVKSNLKTRLEALTHKPCSEKSGNKSLSIKGKSRVKRKVKAKRRRSFCHLYNML